MTQPAVTFQIKQLEEQYNTRAVRLGHGRNTLTTAGELVMAYAERILGLTEELESRVSELTDELRAFFISYQHDHCWLLAARPAGRLQAGTTRGSFPAFQGNSQLIESRGIDRN